MRTLIGELGRVPPAAAARAFADLREAGEAALARDGLSGEPSHSPPTCVIAARSTPSPLRSPAPAISDGDTAATRELFDAQHDHRYGHAAPDQSIEIVNLRLVVTLPRMDDAIGRWLSRRGRRKLAAPKSARRVLRRSGPGRSGRGHLWRPGLAAGTRSKALP